MADIPGSIKATQIELEGEDNTINTEGTLEITATEVLIQNLHYPAVDGATGQVLTTDGEGSLGWTAGVGTGANTLNDLQDVTVNTPLADQVLQYNDATSLWENKTFNIGSFGLDELSDVGINTPAPNDLLFYNGSFWVNFQPGITVLSDVDTTTSPAQENNVLLYKTDTWVPGVATRPGDNVSTLVNDSLYLQDINAESIDELADVDTTTTPPTTGQALTWNGTTWVPTDKTDNVVGATNGNFAGLDATGNLTDSGSKTADFATAIHTHVEADITNLDRMGWRGNWVQGTYQKNDVVYDDGFTMIANVETTDRAAPQPDSTANWELPNTPAWNGSDPNPARVMVGVEGTVAEQSAETGDDIFLAVVTSVRVWRPSADAGLNTVLYLFDITDSDPGVLLFSQQIPTGPVGWVEVNISNYDFLPSTKIRAFASHEIVTGSSTWNHTWNYDGVNTEGDPGLNSYTRNIDRSELYVSTTDNVSIDRSASLAQLKVGDEIDVREDDTRWDLYEVSGTPINNTSWYSIPVTRIANGGDVRTARSITITATIKSGYNNVTTEYLTDYWIGAVIGGAQAPKGFRTTDISAITLDDNAYGIDLKSYSLIGSDQWDLIASGTSSSNNETEVARSSSGTIRPTDAVIGEQFFDTSLSPAIPVWWNGTNWVDATGTTV